MVIVVAMAVAEAEAEAEVVLCGDCSFLLFLSTPSAVTTAFCGLFFFGRALLIFDLGLLICISISFCSFSSVPGRAPVVPQRAASQSTIVLIKLFRTRPGIDSTHALTQRLYQVSRLLQTSVSVDIRWTFLSCIS